MTSHVAAEKLALLAEGLLDGAEELSVRSHLATCSECAEISDSLAEVTEVLAEAQFPGLSEADVARLDAALANQELIDAAPMPDPSLEGDGQGGIDGVDSAREKPDVPIIPLRNGDIGRNGKRPTRWMPYLMAAAATVFVIGGGMAALQSLLGTEPQQMPDASPDDSEVANPDIAQPYHATVVESGIDYTRTGFDTQARELVNRSSLPGENTTLAEEAEPLLPLAEDPSGEGELQECAQRADELGDTGVSLIDLAEFEGEPAWVMVFAEGGDSAPDEYTVRVFSPDCGADGTAPSDHLLAETQVPAR